MTRTARISLLLFFITALFAVWTSFFVVDKAVLEKVVIYMSYPSLFATVLIFGWSLFHLHRKEVSLLTLVPRKRSALIAITSVSGLLLLMEPFAFKIIFDEPILSATAEMLHFDRLAGMPSGANNVSGSYLLLESSLDKRPLIFPFLISLVHDFTGYRYTNVFYLNGVLTVVLVSLIYILGRLFSGHRGGLLAVLLAGTLPLLSIFATSGHFEILNLVMLSLIMLFSYYYIQQPGETRLVPLVFALTILAQVRYENTLYILPFGILILLGWKKARRIILPWQVILVPLLYIVFSMNYRLILDESGTSFQDGPNGRDATFSLSYAKENLSSAGDYLFSIGQYGSNSYLLSVLGMSSVLAFCYFALRRGRNLAGRDPKGTVMYFYFLSMALFSLVIVFFNYGLFDRYITSRLSLPLQLLFILLVPFMLSRYRKAFVTGTMFFTLICGVAAFSFMFSQTVIRTGIQFGVLIAFYTGVMYWIRVKSRRPMLAFLFIPITYILAVGMPISHAHRYSEKYISKDIIGLELEVIQKLAEKEKIFWLANAPYAGVLTRNNVALLYRFKRAPLELWKYYQDGNCDAVYIPRVFVLNDTGGYQPREESDYLDPDIFKLETVFQQSVGLGVVLRVDKLLDLDLEGKTANQADLPPDSQP